MYTNIILRIYNVELIFYYNTILAYKHFPFNIFQIKNPPSLTVQKLKPLLKCNLDTNQFLRNEKYFSWIHYSTFF